MSSGAAHGPWADVPGVIETRDLKGEVTVVVEIGALTEAALHLRDEEGFNFLSDITAVDYLGWGEVGVSGYIGTGTNNIAAGRNLNSPMTQGLQVVPLEKPKRFAMNYHLLSVSDRPRRLRLQTWVDEGEPVPTVIEIWPTADFHEREAYDLMGIAIAGHPNMKRILLDDDWEGHPLRKDYPIGGEPVRFSEER